jgi:hypothetical protein
MIKHMLHLCGLLLVIVLSFNYSHAGTEKREAKGKKDFYVNLQKDYKINATVHYRRYGVQDVLAVPQIEIYTMKNKNKILSYRTEFHNGTDNGCLRVLSKVEGGRLIAFFVLEELFYEMKNKYFQRILTEFSNERINFGLYEIQKGQKSKILDVELQRDDAGKFNITSLRQYRNGFDKNALFFSDIHEYLTKEILSGTY